MAIRDYQASWIDTYANDGGGFEKIRASHPIGIGGSYDHQTFIRIPDAVRDAINSSRTTAQLHMRIYMNGSRSEVDVGNHNHSSARSMGARGIPSYSYNETWRGLSNGWNSYQMSSWFLPRVVNGSVKGVVLYNTGKSYSEAQGIGVNNYVRFRVTGEWEPIAEASSPRLSDNRQTLGDSIRIYTDRNKDTLTHVLEYKLGNSTVTIDSELLNYTDWKLPNDLANQMPSVRERTGKIILKTYEGSRLVGTRETNLTAIIPYTDDFKPRISNFTWSVYGNGYDKQIDKLIAGVSRIQASFTPSGKFGASIRESSITIGQTFEGANVTSHVITEGGPLVLEAKTLDSRGLQTTSEITVQRESYTEPSLSNFSAKRTTGTNVLFKGRGSFTTLDGSNSLTIKFQRKTTSGTSWSTVYETTSTSGTFDIEKPIDGFSELSSFDVRIVIEDSFGNSSYSQDTIGTTQFPFTWGKDGLAVNKVFEPGLGNFQVSGDSNFTGSLRTQSKGDTSFVEIRNGTSYGNSGMLLGDQVKESTPFLDFFSSGGASADSRIIASLGNKNTEFGGTLRLIADRIDFQTPNALINRVPIAEFGTNNGGEWFKFSNGLLVCYMNISASTSIGVFNNGVYRSDELTHTWPAVFTTPPAVSVGVDQGGPVWWASSRITGTQLRGYLFSAVGRGASDFRYMVAGVGRWN